MSEPYIDKAGKIVGFDARRFILGGAIALRKKGKLFSNTDFVKYDLKYGNNEFEIQEDALAIGENIVLVDDIMANRSTALAGIELVRKYGANIVGFSSVINIEHLDGSKRIKMNSIILIKENT